MKLSDTQLVILNAACQRDDRLVLPLPSQLKGGAAAKVIDSLVAKGLVEEVDAKRDDPIWRKTGDGHGVTLVITDAALAALGIAPGAEPADADIVPGTIPRTGRREGRSERQGPQAARTAQRQQAGATHLDAQPGQGRDHR